jgi:hypothetical protein
MMPGPNLCLPTAPTGETVPMQKGDCKVTIATLPVAAGAPRAWAREIRHSESGTVSPAQ